MMPTRSKTVPLEGKAALDGMRASEKQERRCVLRLSSLFGGKVDVTEITIAWIDGMIATTLRQAKSKIVARGGLAMG